MTVNTRTGSTQKLVTACIKPAPHHSALPALLSQPLAHDCRCWPLGYDRQRAGNRWDWKTDYSSWFSRIHRNFKAAL